MPKVPEQCIPHLLQNDYKILIYGEPTRLNVTRSMLYTYSGMPNNQQVLESIKVAAALAIAQYMQTFYLLLLLLVAKHSFDFEDTEDLAHL